MVVCHLDVYVDHSTLLQRLVDIFFSLQNQTMKKGQSKHIKEIQVFQTYFKIVYNLCQLSRTIYEVTFTLK